MKAAITTVGGPDSARANNTVAVRRIPFARVSSTVLPLQPSSRALAPRSSSPAAGRHHAWRGAPSGGASPPSSRSARPRTESHPTASHDCLGGRTRAGRLALEPQVHTCMVVPWARPRIWNLRKTPGRFNLDSGVELADDARKNAVYCHNIAPDFAGWDTNPDWAFNLVFGYLNRNCEDISIFPSGRTACSSPKDFGEQPVRVDVDRPRENRERLAARGNTPRCTETQIVIRFAFPSW